jgi:hypothetical protein
VKQARCTVDPDWVFCYKKSETPRAQKKIRHAIQSFIIATSYVYEDEHGYDIDPTRYEDPRENCDHTHDD